MSVIWFLKLVKMHKQLNECECFKNLYWQNSHLFMNYVYLNLNTNIQNSYRN